MRKALRNPAAQIVATPPWLSSAKCRMGAKTCNPLFLILSPPPSVILNIPDILEYTTKWEYSILGGWGG